MKSLMPVLALALAAATMPSLAADAASEPKKPSAAQAKQQEKMTQCNKDATGKSGDERKAFMSDCLSGKTTHTTQQDKMTACNASAGEKKGDERKAYMSECLKKK